MAEKEQNPQLTKPAVPYRKRVVIDILPSGEITTTFRLAEGQTMLTKPELNRLVTALRVGWQKEYQKYRLGLAIGSQQKDVTNASKQA